MYIQRILVPVDGSELSVRAIEVSVALAAQLGASIVGFIAQPRGRGPAGRRLAGLRDNDPPDTEVLTDSAAQALLARFEAAAQAARVPFEGVCTPVARIDKGIIATAESHACDMIVMVTHGRGAFGEFLFGSQTKAVLAGSQLPLLVLH